MSARFRNVRIWVGFICAALLTLLIWGVTQRVGDVAAVQNAVQRDWEISFWDMRSPTDKPAGLPTSIDSAVGSWFDRRFAHTFGYDGTQPTKTRNRSTVFQERFRALFRGSMQDIHIWYPETFHGGELGAAMARFPDLRRVSVFENDTPGPTEADWTLLTTRLRTFRHLEEIELGGAGLTDAAIAPLAGHPILRSVTITDGHLTAGCVKTFVSIPRLATLHIEGQRYDGDVWLSPESQQAMIAALPSVTVELP